MWSVALIIGIAVATALPVMVGGVWLAVSVERRRNLRLMQQHGMNRRLSIHRPNLSANENNYESIPRPSSRVLRSGRPARIPVMWNCVPSEEAIAPEPEPEPEHIEELVNHESMPPTAKRRKQSSISGHSFSLPKTRRQKKIRKAILLTQVPQSPLSAITESTDSTPCDTPIVAELPIEMTSKTTPDRRSMSPQQLHITKTRPGKTASQELEPHNRAERPSFARSVSTASSLTAPAEPLPPLPTFDIYKRTRHNEPWRNSINSLDTVGSSVLGMVISSPSRAPKESGMPSTNLDSMQTFEFGFEETRSSARLGFPPGKQAMQGYCTGKTGISSIRPSFDYYGGRATSLESAYHQRLEAADDAFETIDTSSWKDIKLPPRSRSNRTRHSMQDYGSILGKRTHLDDSIQHSPSLLRRPASVASGNPYHWDRKAPIFSTNRLSVGSNESRKGHKRQNCVRIANLPLPEPRNSRVLAEVQEEQPETPNGEEVKIPGLTLLEAGQPILRARASLVDVRGSPSPIQDTPVLNPTRPRRPLGYRTSASSTALARPDFDVFSTGQPDPRTPEPFRNSARPWPLTPTPTPTPTNNIKRNSMAQPNRKSYDSPTLPSPINTANIFPRKSLVKGPRNPPPSITRRNGSPSPLGHNQKRISKTGPDDLRKSIMTLRSMNSEGRLLDLGNKSYRTIGEEADDLTISVSPTTGSLNSHPYPRERRYGSAAFGARSKMSITMSPSGMSLGGASIWEDASVRGDSPEPEMPPIPTAEDADEQQHMTPRLVFPRPEPDPEAYENIGPSGAGKIWRERERDAFEISAKYQSPQGKGLGLRTGNAVLGTPGSLYDRDGFLKD